MWQISTNFIVFSCRQSPVFYFRLLSPSSCVSPAPCAFSSAASSAAFKHWPGRYHSDLSAAVAVVIRAAAVAVLPGPLRGSRCRMRLFIQLGHLVGAAHLLQRFQSHLRAQKASPHHLPLSLCCSLNVWTFARHLPPFGFGQGRAFLLTALLPVLPTVPLLSLHAGDGPTETLTADWVLFLLRHVEERVDPHLSLNRMDKKAAVMGNTFIN